MPAAKIKKKLPIQTALSACGGEKDKLRLMAQDLAAGLFALDSECGDCSGELLDAFISELVLSAADQRRKAERRKHQRACVAAAQARGVRFGRAPKPLPDDFDEFYQAWRDGELSLREAAESCGMDKNSFHRAVQRIETAAAQ